MHPKPPRQSQWWLVSAPALGLILGPFVLALFGIINVVLDQTSDSTLNSYFVDILDDSYLRRVVVFTFWQASLSTILSVGIALPLSRALARRNFIAKQALLRVLSVAIVAPPIVAVFGLIVVHGRQGWVNSLLQDMGWHNGSYLYGLTGILLAHVFFNLPLATRIILQRMQTIAPEQWRMVEQLGMNSWQHWRLLEWPHIRPVLAPLAALIYALCFTSFAIVMSLGGGPKATTLEVAIYQAVRLDFDLFQASTLSLVQLILCAAILWLGLRLGQPVSASSSPMINVQRPDSSSPVGKFLDSVLILICVSLVALPLTGVVLAGINEAWMQVLGDVQLWQAAWNSLWVAASAAGVCLLMAWGMLLMRRHTYNRWPQVRSLLEAIGMMTLVVPALVLGTGLFLALYQWVDVFSINLYLVLLINAVLGLPFMLRILTVPYLQLEQQQGRLCQSLGIQGWQRLQRIEWPCLRSQAGLGLAIVAAFSMGDLGVIALFGTPDVKTLPLLMYQRLGSYQADSAAVTALVLVVMCLGVFVLFEKTFSGKPLVVKKVSGKKVSGNWVKL